MSKEDVCALLDARDVAHRAELAALRSRYAALVGVVMELDTTVVTTTSKYHQCKCLMCDSPYGGSSISTDYCALNKITARCGHVGVGDDCAHYDPVLTGIAGVGGPCMLRADAHDCFACRPAVLAVPAPAPAPKTLRRPAKCLMCDAPYGSDNHATGIRIDAQCGCHGVGFVCCDATVITGAGDWCDKQCNIDPHKNACFACRQVK